MTKKKKTPQPHVRPAPAAAAEQSPLSAGGGRLFLSELEKGNFKVCELIIQAANQQKFDATLRNEYGETALLLAARMGQMELCAQLMECGADVNAAGGRVGSTPLHEACAAAAHNQETVYLCELLIQYGADVNARTVDEDTPLHWAAAGVWAAGAEMWLAELCSRLIGIGADVEAVNVDGDTPLSLTSGPLHSFLHHRKTRPSAPSDPRSRPVLPRRRAAADQDVAGLERKASALLEASCLTASALRGRNAPKRWPQRPPPPTKLSLALGRVEMGEDMARERLIWEEVAKARKLQELFELLGNRAEAERLKGATDGGGAPPQQQDNPPGGAALKLQESLLRSQVLAEEGGSSAALHDLFAELLRACLHSGGPDSDTGPGAEPLCEEEAHNRRRIEAECHDGVSSLLMVAAGLLRGAEAAARHAIEHEALTWWRDSLQGFSRAAHHAKCRAAEEGMEEYCRCTVEQHALRVLRNLARAEGRRRVLLAERTCRGALRSEEDAAFQQLQKDTAPPIQTDKKTDKKKKKRGKKPCGPAADAADTAGDLWGEVMQALLDCEAAARDELEAGAAAGQGNLMEAARVAAWEALRSAEGRGRKGVVAAAAQGWKDLIAAFQDPPIRAREEAPAPWIAVMFAELLAMDKRRVAEHQEVLARLDRIESQCSATAQRVAVLELHQTHRRKGR